MKRILIAGTGAWKNDGSVDWYCPGSNFSKFLIDHQEPPTFDASNQPFIWSTEVDGLGWFSRKNHVQWAAGGVALKYFIRDLCDLGEPVALLAHSHGLQVALYAAGVYGLKVQKLISLGSPVRKDMMAIAKAARPNIATWLHVHSDNSDKWQILGELFDGHFGIVREHPLADKNDAVPGVGHSELVRDPNQFHYWVDRKWLDWL